MKTRAHLPRYGVGPAYVYGVILFTAAGMWQADAAFPSGQTAGALRLGLALLGSSGRPAAVRRAGPRPGGGFHPEQHACHHGRLCLGAQPNLLIFPVLLHRRTAAGGQSVAASAAARLLGSPDHPDALHRGAMAAGPLWDGLYGLLSAGKQVHPLVPEKLTDFLQISR